MATTSLEPSQKTRLGEETFDQLFREARTYNAFRDLPVSDDVLRQLYELMKWGPTSANCCPARILFLRTPEAKERLRPTLEAGNVEKTLKAPVTAVIAHDLKFYDQLPKLSPQIPAIRDLFANSAELAATTAFRNGSLQGGYFILAARSLGLDCGPMSGFDNAKVDAAFFPDGRFKSNFLVNLGYGDPAKLFPRNPRLSFEEQCRIV